MLKLLKLHNQYCSLYAYVGVTEQTLQHKVHKHKLHRQKVIALIMPAQSFSSHKAHRAALTSISLALSQTPVYPARQCGVSMPQLLPVLAASTQKKWPGRVGLKIIQHRENKSYFVNKPRLGAHGIAKQVQTHQTLSSNQALQESETQCENGFELQQVTIQKISTVNLVLKTVEAKQNYQIHCEINRKCGQGTCCIMILQ